MNRRQGNFSIANNWRKKVPDTFSLSALQPTAAGSAKYSVVTWQVRAAKAGDYTVQADVADIGVAAEKVRVCEKSLFEQ